MTKLNKFIAINKGIKASAYAAQTTFYQTLQKAPLLTGLIRTYRPLDEDDQDILPPERTAVQIKAEETLAQIADLMARPYDVEASVAWGNCMARADVVVGGTVLFEKAPVTFLLFLEKQLNDLLVLTRKIQTLPSDQEWHWDTGRGLYVTEPIETRRTKKVPRNHEMAPATKEHPAQVRVYEEDKVVGIRTTIHMSGALPETRRDQLANRIQELLLAVKAAREEANGTDVDDVHIGDKLFRYLFGS